jgi:PhnB protein
MERRMHLSPHLTFNGQCEEAFKFYEGCLGGKIVMLLRYGDSPMAEQVPLEWRGKVVHATLTVGDKVLLGADILPEQYQPPRGFFILLGPEVPAEAERIFHALAENGSVQIPLQKVFWSPAFGALVDQFGIPWEISCRQAASGG